MSGVTSPFVLAQLSSVFVWHSDNSLAMYSHRKNGSKALKSRLAVFTNSSISFVLEELLPSTTSVTLPLATLSSESFLCSSSKAAPFSCRILQRTYSERNTSSITSSRIGLPISGLSSRLISILNGFKTSRRCAFFPPLPRMPCCLNNDFTASITRGLE